MFFKISPKDGFPLKLINLDMVTVIRVNADSVYFWIAGEEESATISEYTNKPDEYKAVLEILSKITINP